MELSRLTIVFLVSVAATTCVSAQPQDQISEIGTSKFTRSKTQSHMKTIPTLTLRIYDFDQTRQTVIENAKRVASDIFRVAGVKTQWVDCTSEGLCRTDIESPEFRLRIIPHRLEKEMTSDDALGVAIPCADDEQACIAYIFNSKINNLTATYHLSAGRLLGHVIAHEIGHELLGPSAHGFGIMQGRLPISETERILFFTSGQAKELRAELAARAATLEKARLPSRSLISEHSIPR